MFPGRIISKVPGSIPVESKQEKQGYIGDLSKKTIPQLNELLERQLKLLANKGFINQLADKGEKIKKLKETVEDELKERNGNEKLSKMMAALSMNGKEDLDALEWTGRCAPGYAALEKTNQSDDEEDTLKILATHSGAGFHKKKHKIIKPEEPLIKPSDLAMDEAQADVDGGEVLEEYAKHLCDRLDSTKDVSSKGKFLPHRSLKHPVEEGREPKKVSEWWEVTAATPPPPVHGDTKLVSLQESIRLQCVQHQRLKEIQVKHAAERLSGWQGCGVASVPQTLSDYRDPGSRSSSDDELSEHEVHDEEHPDGGGVTIYNLVDEPIN